MNKTTRQSGFVSILVTMILMVITSLLVLSFAYLARQNQTRNLNRQLSTQAFYAAESGVNDAVAKIKANPSITNSDCNQTNQFGNQQLGDPALNVSYTCVLVDQSPTSLAYDSISTDNSTVVHIISNDANTLQLSWQDTKADPGFSDESAKFQLPQKPLTDVLSSDPSKAGSFSLKTADFPNHTGILRATIIPANAVGNNLALLNASRNYFLYPQASASAATAGVSSTSVPDGSWVSGQCNTGNSGSDWPRFCNVKIIGISGNFYLRLKAIYKPVAVTVRALDGVGSTATAKPIAGAQAVIDSTGKAQNVLRRIQVRLPLTPSYLWPEFALETSDTICKRFSVWPGGAQVITPSDTGEGDLYTTSKDPLAGPANNKDEDAQACALPGQTAPLFP